MFSVCVFLCWRCELGEYQMTKEVEILRNALAEKLFDGGTLVHEQVCHYEIECDCIYGIARKLLGALNEADAVKPSEEDIYQLSELEKLHLGGHVNSNELMPDHCIGCWQISKLKKYMGIE